MKAATVFASIFLSKQQLWFHLLMTGKPVEVSRVATKGQEKAEAEGWVTQYSISLSADGLNFTNYEEGGKTKVNSFAPN